MLSKLNFFLLSLVLFVNQVPLFLGVIGGPMGILDEVIEFLTLSLGVLGARVRLPQHVLAFSDGLLELVLLHVLGHDVLWT